MSKKPIRVVNPCIYCHEENSSYRAVNNAQSIVWRCNGCGAQSCETDCEMTALTAWNRVWATYNNEAIE